MLFAGQLIILRTNGFLAIVSFLFRVNAARRHEHMLRESFSSGPRVESAAIYKLSPQ